MRKRNLLLLLIASSFIVIGVGYSAFIVDNGKDKLSLNPSVEVGGVTAEAKEGIITFVSVEGIKTFDDKVLDNTLTVHLNYDYSKLKAEEKEVYFELSKSSSSALFSKDSKLMTNATFYLETSVNGSSSKVFPDEENIVSSYENGISKLSVTYSIEGNEFDNCLRRLEYFRKGEGQADQKFPFDFVFSFGEDESSLDRKLNLRLGVR